MLTKIGKLLTKYYRDIIVIFTILVMGLISLIGIRCSADKNSSFLSVYIENEIVLKNLDLSKENDERILDIDLGEIDMEIHVKKNAVKVEHSGCPHQDCVNLGWTSSSTRPIVCTYYKVVLVLSNSNGFDLEI